MINMGYLEFVWKCCADSKSGCLEDEGKKFVEKTNYKEDVVSEILSSLSNCPIKLSSNPRWHPVFVDDIKLLQDYVLQLLKYEFNEGTTIKNVYCHVKDIDNFTIGFTFAKFTEIKNIEYYERGNYLVNDNIGVDILLRSGDYITILDDEHNLYNSKIQFRWDEPEWATGKWIDGQFILDDGVDQYLNVDIKVPIYELFELSISYPH